MYGLRQEPDDPAEPDETSVDTQQQPHLPYLHEDFQEYAFLEPPHGQAQHVVRILVSSLQQEIQIQEQHEGPPAQTHDGEKV